ncbi:MAG: hypothetical protein K8S97_03810 [Anaerolineae bacterium]|nr:hypothetical protein [Anaerolineae bacterium]
MRLTGRHVVIAALLVTCASIAIPILLSNTDPDNSRTELLPGVNLFGGSGASQPHALRLTPAYDPDAEALVLIQGITARRLVLWPLDGSTPPQEIDHHIAAPLLSSPDGSGVLYGTDHTVMVLDVHARRAIIVGLLPLNSHLVHAQWSPDNSAIAYVVQTPLRLVSYYTLADGTFDAAEMIDVPYGLSLNVGWTPEGAPVSMTLGVGARGGLTTLYYRYDPISGSIENLIDVLPRNTVDSPAPPVPIIQPWSPWRSPDRTQQVYSTTSWEETRYQGTCRTGPLAIADGTWLAQTLRTVNYQHHIAFEIAGLYMDQASWLDDGRIVFRAVADPVCTELDSGFYVAALGHIPLQIIDAEPEYVSDEANKLLWTASYALSPDQTRIAWTHNDIANGRATTYARSLDPTIDTPPEILLETSVAPPDPGFAFQDEEMILYFVWLP